jgi:ribonucleoside-diphosphate reductase alpha chain
MAGELGTFPEFAANKDAMLRVVRIIAAPLMAKQRLRRLTKPVALDLKAVPTPNWRGGQAGLGRRPGLGKQHGFRNAQARSRPPAPSAGDGLRHHRR